MNRNIRPILACILTFALITAACSITNTEPNAEAIASTAVAETVAAMVNSTTVSPTLTAEITATESLPTAEPLPIEYPLRVSFASPNGDLFTWTEDMAAPFQLSDTGDVCCSYVSPDGSMVAYTRYAADYSIISLEVINSDGTNQRVLMDAAGFAGLPRPTDSIGTEPYQIAWIPGTHTIAINTRLLFEGPGLAIGANLYLIDADTGTMSSLLSEDDNSWNFFFSPNGSQLAVTTPTQIDLYNSDGTLAVDNVLTYEFVNTASEYAWTAFPVWSQDNSTLVVDVPPVNPFPYESETLEDTTLWRLRSDGTSGEIVNSVPMSYAPGSSVAYSDNLEKILYFTTSSDNTSTLHLANIDGSESIDYASGVFADLLAWSPDNSHFYYAINAGTNNTPYIGEVNSTPSALTDYGNAMTVKWLDNDRYLVSTFNSGHWQLLLGTISSPTGLIYETTSVNDFSNLTFSINR